MEAVIDALRREAGGRSDLLAHAAGSLIGNFLAEPTITRSNEVLAAAALLVAGADPAAAIARADHVRQLRARAAHTPPEPVPKLGGRAAELDPVLAVELAVG